MTDNCKQVVGAVVIGRNEGERLVTCLASLSESLTRIVYVDSGSTDNSVEQARVMGVSAVTLDMTVPFTAARARNEGADYLCKLYPDICYVQFVDGDCEVRTEWLEHAYEFMDSHLDYAIACGRRRERYPENSVYNQLCDIEWNTPIGDALSCGGDALIRVESFKQVAGYNGQLIAGEEPEMCFRLRREGWKVRRLDVEMTLHDAAMAQFRQWWKRAKRAGYAYANSFYLHGQTTEEFKRRETVSIIVWAGLIPLLIFALCWVEPMFVLLLLIYPLQVARIILQQKANGLRFKMAFCYALSTVGAKFPQFFGLTKFGIDLLKGREGRLIEYK